MFRALLSELIKNALPGAGEIQYFVAAPDHPEHGDYATNAALVAAKTLGRPPTELALLIQSQLAADHRIAQVHVAWPGFVNMTLSDRALADGLLVPIGSPNAWGRSDAGNGKTAIVEYFQLNIAKRPHVGHLRSAVIGDALKRILISQGYRAISDTHVGDWGTQFGILILGYKAAGKPEIAGDPFAALEAIYQAEYRNIESDPQRRELAKEEFAKLERGDPENRRIWEWMLQATMRNLIQSAERLGLLPFDEHRGESAYEADMPGIVALALQNGVAVKKEDGAVVVDLSADRLGEAVLVKSDGASTYLLRDLATIRYRKEQWNFWKNLYVVDVRQSHHFQQLFRVAELLGFEGVGESEHIAFGLMTLPEGPMSTRKGNALSLNAVLDEAQKRALAVIRQKNPDLSNPTAIAATVGCGALKYFDLSHHRSSDIVFRWEEALAFEGNTGPYLQYTYARLRSILRKITQETNRALAIEIPKDAAFGPLEHRIAVSILRFPEAIEDALLAFAPHVLANYLFGLAQSANEFYHSHPVSQESDPGKRSLRVALVAATATTLARGLELLGISAPEEI